MRATIKTASKDHIQIKGTWTFIWSDENGKELRRQVEENLVVTTGLIAYAMIIAGTLDQTCAAWCALGTGTTAAAAGDTALETESTRKVVTTKTTNSGTIIYRTYFLTGEAVGDYTEWGIFLEATSLAGSGRLLNRLVPTGGVSKDSNENLTVEVRIALTAA